VLLDVLASLRQNVRDVEPVLLLAEAGPLVEKAQSLGVAVRVVELPPALAGLGDSGLRGGGRFGKLLRLAQSGGRASFALSGYLRKLRWEFFDLRPDVIHANGIKAHLLAALANRRAFPLVWHIHDFVSLRPLIRYLLRAASPLANGAVAISRAVAVDFQRAVPRLPVPVVANAVDLQRFAPRSADAACLDRLAGLPRAPAGIVRIGLIATYARWKGQEVFLQVAAAIPRGKAVRFYVIGGPIYRTAGSQFSLEELSAYAASLGIASSVGFVPFQADPADVYRALDIVVHASTLPEAFGLTVAEAMACGRAVIVSNAGGAAELFTDGVDALGHPPGDVAALAARLRQLIEDPGLRERLGTNARLTAEQKFDRSRLGPDLLRAYAEILGKGRDLVL